MPNRKVFRQMPVRTARPSDFLRWGLSGWGLVGVALCLFASTADGHPAIPLRDVTDSTGISFRHTDGSGGNYYIVEYVSAGLALFDYDSDGDVDIYFLNGSPMPGTNVETPPVNALYRNDGNWRFTDVTLQAGVGDTRHGLAVTVGDYDNDGHPDLYLNNFGPNVLYRNKGDGTFEDVTDQAGVQNGERVGGGVSFLDIDRDGDLDLYVANYVKFSFEKHVPRTQQGFLVYGSPLDYPPDADTLFRNNGDGTFSDVSRHSRIAEQAGYGMGMVCTDIDADGDTDVLVGNDTGANFLFRNDGTGRFEDIGLLHGFAYDGTGAIQGTMGVECADYDNDGRLDLHVTSYQEEAATLYRNMDGYLEDVTVRTGAGLGTIKPVTWGNGLVDLDNDGDRDLFIACGHLNDNVLQLDNRTSYHARNMLLANDGNGKYVDISDRCGDGLDVKLSSRGAGFDDLDNDGDLDIVILNSRREPTLLRNDSDRNNHWIDIQLRGTHSNREGIGVRVEVVAGDLLQTDEVRSGRGYQGHFGSRLHFGLGNHARVDEIRIHWPEVRKQSGLKRAAHVQTVRDVSVDRVLRIEEEN